MMRYLLHLICYLIKSLILLYTGTLKQQPGSSQSEMLTKLTLKFWYIRTTQSSISKTQVSFCPTSSLTCRNRDSFVLSPVRLFPLQWQMRGKHLCPESAFKKSLLIPTSYWTSLTLWSLRTIRAKENQTQKKHFPRRHWWLQVKTRSTKRWRYKTSLNSQHSVINQSR